MRTRSICLLLFLLLLGCAWTASAEELYFQKQSFPSDAASIDLGNIRVSDWNKFYNFLDQFEHLQHVDMFSTRVTGKRADEMTERYPGVSFGWTLSFGDHTVRTEATAFSTLHWSGAKVHSGTEISVVRYCKQLKALDIGHNGVKDLSFLYELPELRVLIIACNKVEDITPIGSLTKLEYLEMFSNQVTDLTPLHNLDHLMDLNIGYNRIGDVSQVYAMPQLKRLWMYNCINRNRQVKISEDELKELHKHLPETIIDTTHNPSEGGWRTGSHYETIHEIFQKGTYIPFEDSIPE